MNRRIASLTAALAVAALTLLTSCSAASASPTAPTGGVAPSAVTIYDSAKIKAAVKTLNTLAVKGRSPKTGYTRTQFGAAWKDVDHNGCDTRNDILARDLTNETFKSGTHNCVVLTGKLYPDPYTNLNIDFVRGVSTSSLIQIDHVVALSNAWQTGASTFFQTCTAKAGDDAYNAAIKAGKSVAKAKLASAAAKLAAKPGCDTKARTTREALANDPVNLMAVQGKANSSKSDSDAASWLPPNKAYRCTYVAKQVEVKAKYALWVTAAEKAAISGLLTSCASGAKAVGAIEGNLPLDSSLTSPTPDATPGQTMNGQAESAPVIGFVTVMVALAGAAGFLLHRESGKQS